MEKWVSRMKIVFMGTPEFAVPGLRALFSSQAKALGIEVVGIYTQPDRPVGRGMEISESPVKAWAIQNAKGVPIFQPEKLSVPGEFEKLSALKPDLITVVAFGQILKQEVLSLPRLGCINVHSSLLPRWRGAAPIQWAILGGDKETGVSVQKMVLKLDEGDVIHSVKTPVSDSETATSLHDRLKDLGARALFETIEMIEASARKKVPLVTQAQDPKLATYAKKLTKDMQWLDPKKGAIELDREIRALNPWPGTSVKAEGEGRLRIHKAKLWADLAGQSATLFERSGMLLLGCGGGSLEILEIQKEGQKRLTSAQFMQGLKGQGKSLPLRLG